MADEPKEGRQPRPWPTGLPACLKCCKPKKGLRYASRGLCRSCYDYERHNGTLKDWLGHSAAMSGINNVALKACMLVGLTRASKDLNIPKATLTRWARGGTPTGKRKRLSAYVKRIKKLENESEVSEEREALFSDECIVGRDPWEIREGITYPAWDE